MSETPYPQSWYASTKPSEDGWTWEVDETVPNSDRVARLATVVADELGDIVARLEAGTLGRFMAAHLLEDVAARVARCAHDVTVDGVS